MPLQDDRDDLGGAGTGAALGLWSREWPRLSVGLRPADLAQQLTRHPCSQTGWLRGWTQTRRDLGTRRSRCSPGSRGTGGHSQWGRAAGRAAHRTPAAPVAGPLCPLGCRSPSPGGCLGQMQGRGVRSKEKQTTPVWASLPAGPRGHRFCQTEAGGGLISQCHFQAILVLSLQAHAISSVTPRPWDTQPSFRVQVTNPGLPMLSPYSCFSFWLIC